MAKAIDLTGQRFGRLVAVRRADRKNPGGGVLWECRCDCGNTTVVEAYVLRCGNTTGCGRCWRIKDETGKRYGMVTVIHRANKPKGQGAMWLCRCDCGKEFVTRGSSLRKGETCSCGCVAAEKLRLSVILPYGVAARNQILRRLKANARERRYFWGLTDEQAIELMEGDCFYCGASKSNLSRHPEQNGVYYYNGIDRVDNTRGYVIGNVVSCCKHCNIAKRDRTVSDFLRWVEKVYRFSVLGQSQEV